jgi:protoporphyrinogen oxidase
VWDRHYHVTLLSDTYLRRLLRELGLETELVWGETKTGFYAGGRLHSMSNTLEFLRFPPLRLIDKLRLGGTIFYASKIKNWRRLERILATDWLERLSGRRTYDKIWLPLLRAKLGDNYRIASAAFIWATIARLYAARRTGLKKEKFGYLAGGYERVLKRFGEALREHGVDIRVGRAVQRLAAGADGGVEATLDGEGYRHFDRLVATVPAPDVARLCPQLTLDERARLEGIRYQGILCASLLLRKPLSAYYVTNITDEGFPYTGVIEMSALVDRQRLGGHALVYLPKYLPAESPAFRLPDEHYEAQFLESLERMYPHFRRTDVLAFRVSRVRRVCAVPTLDYSRRVPGVTTSMPGLYLVNGSQIVNGTLNVNETIKLAEEAVGRIAGPAGVLDESPLEEVEQHVTANRELVAGP